jgi:NTE family protein
MDDEPTVAIACQGGGSHTAFTAGVLDRLFEEAEDGYELIGLSGTSGGALCALLAWYGYLHEGHDSGDLLVDFWADVAARQPIDRGVNHLTRRLSHLRGAGAGLPEVSPHLSLGAFWSQRHLSNLIERRVDFDRIPALLDGDHPGLFISAIEVLTGEFEVFREDGLRPEMLLASAAEPNLFSAVEVDGGMYWDGLFSKNPPIHDFNVADDVPDPDEIWLIRINPERRLRVPRSLNGIADRRNELSGNLSLSAEIRFVRQVNRWIEQGYLPERYTHTAIEQIRLERNLDWTTKLDRSPVLLDRLLTDGREAAEAFLDERLE